MRCLSPLRERQVGTPHAASFSADSARLRLWSAQGLDEWDTATAARTREVCFETRTPGAGWVLSSDGKLGLTQGCLVDVTFGGIVQALDPNALEALGGVTAVALAPDKTRFAIGTGCGIVLELEIPLR